MPKPDPKPVRCPQCTYPDLIRKGNHTVCPHCLWEDSCCDGAPLTHTQVCYYWQDQADIKGSNI